MKQKFLLLGLLLFMVSCNNIDSSQVSSISSLEQVSSSSESKLTKIKISLVNEINYASSLVDYKVSFEPSDAYCDYILSTDTPDILLINDKEVKALYMGEAKLKVTTIDGTYSDEISFNVFKPNPYSTIIDKLEKAFELEQIQCNKTDITYTYSSEIYQDEYEGFNVIYNDGLYSFDESNNVDTYKYIENEYLNEFIIDRNNSSIEQENVLIGDTTNSISLDDANKMSQLSEFNDEYGLSKVCQNLLLDNNLFYMDEVVLNAVLKENESKNHYNLETSAYYLASSLDEEESKISLEFAIDFDESQRLTSAKFNIKKYLVDDNNQIPALPSIEESYDFNLSYGKRESMSFDKKDYQVSSFEIDTSEFKVNNEKYVLEIDEAKQIKIINELPALHIKEKYRLEIEDESIIKCSNNLEIVGLKVGTTNVKVLSNNNIERSISIMVIEPLVNRISLGYIPNFALVGDSFKISATCYPSAAVDKSYLITVKEGDENKASIIKNENDEYIFTALDAGSVTIIAISNSNPEIKDETSIVIKKQPTVEEMKNKLIKKTYKATDSSLTFDENNNGTLTLQGGGEFTFSWSLRMEGTYVYIDFSNVVTTTSPSRWYTFKGSKGSYTDSEASFISLVVYDLDYEENWVIQFS